MSLIHELRISKLHIPLQMTFRHASASRSVTSSIWVEAVGSHGQVGFGESCPREYVTGEDLDSCHAFFAGCREDLTRTINSVDDLRTWVVKHRQAIDRAPAAWCAIELAILDLLARKAELTTEQLLGIDELDGAFQYTAVLGDQGETAFARQLQQYQSVGFPEFKVKLNGDAAQDSARLCLLRDAGIDLQRTRVDANNLWPTAQAAQPHLIPLAESFFAIEEPLKPGDYDGMRRLAQTLDKAIILDESFLRAEQFDHIEQDADRWLINLRVSKMGGLIRSLDIVQWAGEKSIGVIVGAQVGESSVLTRAALSVAQTARSILRGQEGAFGTLLLETDVVDQPLVFGKGGRLVVSDCPCLSAPLEIVRPTDFLEEF